MRKIWFLLCFSGFSILLAQDISDVYRWSYIGIGGTARSAGLANAITAVGGDAMSASINPAGLGLYRKADLMFTLSTRTGTNRTNYLEDATQAGRFNMAISNLAMVFPVSENDRDGDSWQGLTAAFYLNQTNNFARRTEFSGYNATNSICDYYTQEAFRTGVGTSSYYSGMAYNTYLIDTVNTTSYLSAIAGGKVNQNFSRFESGRLGEYGMALSGNYAEKFFIGAGVNIVRGVYKREIEYSEETQNGASFNYTFSNNGTDGYGLFRSTLTDNLRTTATGVNAKLGILIKPNNTLRVGINFQSPTLLSLTDTYSSEITSDFSYKIGNPTFTAPNFLDSLRGTYNYSITTPAHLNVGAAIILDKKLMLTGEIEYINYLNARISDRNNSFKAVTREVARSFRAVLNTKLAAEYRLTKGFQVRAGFAMLNSPFAAKAREYTSNGSVKTLAGWQPNVSGGVGFRDEEYYFDLVGIWNLSQEKYYPYTVSSTPSPLAISKYSVVQIFFTLGFRF